MTECEGRFVPIAAAMSMEMRLRSNDAIEKARRARPMVKEGVSDVVQDVFLKAWANRHQLNDRTLLGFQKWLIVIGRNELPGRVC